MEHFAVAVFETVLAWTATAVGCCTGCWTGGVGLRSNCAISSPYLTRTAVS
jgi:hypothetical protein